MQISLCWVIGRERCCSLSRTWFIVPAWWDIDVTQMNWLLTPRFLPGVVLYNTPCKWHVDMTSGRKKNLGVFTFFSFLFFFFFSWDTIITGYSIPKMWNASDSFTNLVICWDFPSVLQRIFFLVLFFMLTVRERFHWLVNSTCWVSEVQHSVWTSWLVWIVQIILSNMHCCTFISECAVALAGYF